MHQISVGCALLCVQHMRSALWTFCDLSVSLMLYLTMLMRRKQTHVQLSNFSYILSDTFQEQIFVVQWDAISLNEQAINSWYIFFPVQQQLKLFLYKPKQTLKQWWLYFSVINRQLYIIFKQHFIYLVYTEHSA